MELKILYDNTNSTSVSHNLVNLQEDSVTLLTNMYFNPLAP